MATIIDYSTELFSKSGTTRFTKVAQFFGTSKSGKAITKRQLTPTEAAAASLSKSLNRQGVEQKTRYALIDEMSRMHQLSYMNMSILAAAI